MESVPIHYPSIKGQISKLGLTQKETAEFFGITLSGLNHRITADKPQLHWAMFGLSMYLDGHRARKVK